MTSAEKSHDMSIAPLGADATESQIGQTLKTKPRDLDRAAAFLAHSHHYDPLTPEQEKKLKRKLDRWMIPMLLFTATLV